MMEIQGKIDHYASQENVVFTFRKIDKKKSKEAKEVVYDYAGVSLPFEIYKKYKNSEVKITVEKL